MNRVIVTGATSMIGTALIEECIKQNTEVLAIVRKKSKKLDRLPNSKLITIIEADMDQLLSASIPKEKYDCLYHFAWMNTEKYVRDNPKLQYMNVKATLDAVELANRVGCKKFIGAGSQAEYGIYEGVITDDTRVNPLSSYGICKYAAGKLASKLCDEFGMICLWGRIFSVYGKNDNEGTMIRYAFEQYLKGEVAHFSAGEQMWNYLHESDAGKIFYLLGEKCDQSKVYLVAYPKSKPLKEYIEDIRKVLGDGFKYELSGRDNVPRVTLNPDTSVLNTDIDFYPEIDFENGINLLNTEKVFIR